MLHLADLPAHHAPVAGCHLPVFRCAFDTFARRPCFADPVIATRAVGALRALQFHDAFQLLGWVLLPARWHGVAAATSRDAAHDGALRIQVALAGALRRDRAWAVGIELEPVRGDAQLARCARALVFDPVEADLAARPGDYPYWDTVWAGRTSARATASAVKAPATPPLPEASSSFRSAFAS
jgi:hypothetical protein